MKAIRKIVAIGACGVMLGGIASVMTAVPAQGRYVTCDSKVDTWEKQAAKDYSKGRLSADDYAKVQDEIAYHRELWGC